MSPILFCVIVFFGLVFSMLMGVAFAVFIMNHGWTDLHKRIENRRKNNA